MPLRGYILHIEGIPYLLSSYAWSVLGVTHAEPAGATSLGLLSSYSVNAAIKDISDTSIKIDPVKRKLDVGDLTVTLQDDSSNTLTTLFGYRASSRIMWLDGTIEQADAMAGAGTVTVNSIEAGITPINLYCERETFTAASQLGDDFTSVTRARYGSIARKHWGTTGANGYRPAVTDHPQYWANRRCTLYRVDSDAVASMVQVWAGPLINLTPQDYNTWSIKIGSVTRLFETEIMPDPSFQKIWKPVNTDESSGAGLPGNPNSQGNAAQEVFLDCQIEMIREGLTCDTNASKTETACDELNEPDNFWCSQYAIQWKTGNNAGYYTPIVSWDNATQTLTHAELVANNADTDTFDIVKWNSFIPTTLSLVAQVTINERMVQLRHVWPDTANIADSKGDIGLIRNWYLAGSSTGTSWAVGDDVEEVLTNWLWPTDREWPCSPIKIHPLEFLLYVMCSTGEGWNGDWDGFDAQHGAGIDADWIDISGIEDLIDATPRAEFRMAYRGATKIQKIIDDMCAIFGLYPTINGEGQFTLKRIRQPEYNATPDIALTEASIIETPRFHDDHAGITKAIRYEYNYLPYLDRYIASMKGMRLDTDALYADSKTVKQEVNVWIGDDTANISASDDLIYAIREDVQQFADLYLRPSSERILMRAGQPAYTVTVTKRHADGGAVGSGAWPGNLVTLTHDQIPMPDGTRGCTAEYFEIRELRRNFMGYRSTLVLYWLPYLNRGAAWSPAVRVTAWDAGQNDATVSADWLPSGDDATDWFPGGGTVAIHYCAASRVLSAEYGDTEEKSVNGVTATKISFNPADAPTNALVAGDILTYPAYDTVGGEAAAFDWRLDYAFLSQENDADILTDGTVGAADDEPYVLD